MRPSKLTKTVEEDLCAALSNMHTYESAAGYARIGSSTLSLWRSQGRAAREKDAAGEILDKNEARKLKLLDALDQAEAEGVFSLHQVVINAAKVDPHYALRLLAIRRPDDYNPPQRTEVTGAKGSALVIQMTWGDDAVSDADADTPDD